MGLSPHGYEHAVVTGATSGIGQATALRLVRAHIPRVTAIGRNRARLRELDEHEAMRTLAVDLRETVRVRQVLDADPVDILVSNAGVLPATGSFQSMNPADIDAMIETNLAATLRLVRCVLPGMIARGRGHLFFIGSSAGRWPHPDVAVYGATKAAISMFCDSLRCDLAGTAIRVTEICPGRVQTNLYAEMLGREADARLYDGYGPIQPSDIANLMLAALESPANVNVSRIEVFPTTQSVGGSRIVKVPGSDHSTDIAK